MQKEFYQKVTIFLQRSNSCERSEYYASAVELNQLCKTMEEVSIDDIKNIEELEKINCKIDEILNNLGIN